jgi:phospholipid/cholesterol/gamma-HCH transport system substrate-binding protein
MTRAKSVPSPVNALDVWLSRDTRSHEWLEVDQVRPVGDRCMSVHLKAKLIFIVVLCVGSLGVAYWYLWSSGQYTTYRLETHDPVSGLIADSPVELHGVEIGKVTSIELIDSSTVGIQINVAKNAPISKATMATITSRGLAARGFTGYVYVALENTVADAGPPVIDPGHRYAVIPTAPSLTDTMDTTVADAVQQVRLLTQLIQSLLDEKTVASLKQSLDGFQEIMATLVAHNERLGSLIANVDHDSREIGLLLDDKTIASLKRTVGGLQAIMAMLIANDARLRSLLVNAEVDSRDIRPLLETSNATLKELHTEVLPRLYKSLGDLDGLTHSLNGIAARITRDPSSVVRGTVTLPGPGER